MAKQGIKRRPVIDKTKNAKEEPFEFNEGQERVLKLLNSQDGKKITEILIAAGSRCFPAGTLVRTISGYAKIEELQAGDVVLSKNMITGELEGQEILKTFKNKQGHSRKNVIFVLRDGTKIRCTAEHEIYQKDKTYRADTIARRALETGTWVRSEIPSEQLREDTYTELEVYRRDPNNETSFGCERVSSNDAEERQRRVFHCEDAQGCCTDLDREPKQLSGCKSHKQYSGRQLCFEFGVGDPGDEHSAHDETRSADFQQRREKRNEQENRDNRGDGSGDTREIRSYRYETKRMGDVVRYNRIGVSRHRIPKELEARDLDLQDIVEIRFAESTEATYDICVAANHNYLVSEENILVSNSGKTFLIMAILCTLSVKYPGSRHLVARKHFSHVKGAVWLDTLPKVIDLLFKDLKPHLYWNNTDFFLQFPNGSEIWMGGLDDKERVDKILGREYMTIFFNEASEIDYTTYVKVKTRLAQLIPGGKNRIYVDENPPSSKHWTKVLFVDKMNPDNPKMPVKNPQKYAFLQIHPWENKANISPEYLEMIENLPENERLRFFEGKFRDDAKFALWKSETINRYRVYEHPPLRRIVVAVDPAVTAKDDSDETGIVVMGVSFQDELYTLADYTGKYSPTEWATKTVEVYQMWKADKVVAEVNNGGDLVETVVKQVNKYVNYEGVYATRNKYTRAEPVAALMEQGLDHHVGELPDLESEMTTWEGKTGSASPNRIDAKVWAAFALIPELTEYSGRPSGSFAVAMRMGMRLR